MKNTLHQGRQQAARGPRLKLMAAVIAGCMAHGMASANPQGGVVTHGQATFDAQGNVLTIVNTPGTVIDWQNFSINANETTRFLQQSASSAVLNRVVGQDPTQILGALQSNGKVFLINPNGILFGQGAQIDTNGLVASTLDISNEDFLAGKNRFTAGANAAAVENQGTIRTPDGGQVYLIAPSVTNSGVITSPHGDVVLAAGRSVQLVDSSNPDLHVVVSAPEDKALNLGQIVAHSGKVGIFGALIEQRGIVNADSAVIGENGKIVFKASGDTVLGSGSRTSATGAGKGGEIHVLGNRVNVTGDAQIDASGQTGGGAVLVGGDYQGKNTGIANAQQTIFGKNASIRADAIQSGDGGKVILWADDSTRAYGSISAHGGEASGNGGFVETSGKQHLAFDARVDASAKNGKAGTVLLDPATIEIVDGPAGQQPDDIELSDNTITVGDSPGANFIITSGALTSLSGSNLLVEASGNIQIDDLSSNSLFFSGYSDPQYEVRFHSVSGNIRAVDPNDLIATSGSRVILDAGGNIDIGGISSNNGAVNMNAGGGINIAGNIDTSNGGLLGNVSLVATGGPVIVQPGRAIIADALHIQSAGGIGDGTSGAVITEVNSLSADNSGAGDISISGSGPFLSISGINQNGPGNVSISNGSSGISVDGPINTAGGALLLSADSMSINGIINAGMGAVTLAPFSPITNVNLGGQVAVDLPGLALLESDLRKIASAGSLAIHGSSITLVGSLDLTGSFIGRLGLSADGGDLMLNAALNAPSILSLHAASSISQTSNAPISAAAISAQAGNLVSLDQAANAVGVVSGSAAAGDFRYRTFNLLTVSAVDGVDGITVGSSGAIRLVSDSLGINQNSGGQPGGGSGGTSTAPSGGLSPGGSQTPSSAPTSGGALSGGFLVLQTPGMVDLSNTGNRIGAVAADLSGGVSGQSPFRFANTGNLAVGGTILGVTGIRTNNADVELSVGGGTLSLGQAATAINAGTARAELEADSLVLNAKVLAAEADIRTYTQGRAITVGSTSCGSACLSVTNLYNIAAGTIGIGASDPARAPGAINVAGITVGGTAATDRNAVTTRIGLLSAGGVSQTGAINVRDLGVEAHGAVNLTRANQVTNLAASTTSGDLAFSNGGSFTLATLTDQNASSTVSSVQGGYTLTGVSTAGGNISLQANAGDILVASPIAAGTGAISLSAAAGKVSGSGISGASLKTATRDGVSLTTKVSALTATNSGASGDIGITNAGPLDVQGLTQSASGGAGGISIDNTGALKVSGTVSTSNGSGAVALVAHSPLTVDGNVTTGAGAITLEAGSTVGGTTDTLTINGQVSSVSGDILLKAGNDIIGDATSVSGKITRSSNLNNGGLTATSSPDVSQAIQTTISAMNVSTPTSPSFINASTGTVASTAESTADDGSTAAGDSKSDEKKETAGGVTTKDSGAKKNDAPKKTYCN